MPAITASASPCVASTFTSPAIFGADILNITAAPVENFTLAVPPGIEVGVPNPPVIDFCNVTVTYTHPGLNDTIKVETWLPNEWNGRLQALGGGGWIPGRGFVSYIRMLDPVAEGYVATTSDAGLGGWKGLGDWALLSDGNINLYALQNFALTSLNDTATISKSLSQSFYGKLPSYSYWNGCSQGGRQGLAIVDSYPTAYDGVFAAAPAINYAELIASSLWPFVYMQFTEQYPRGCELTQLTSFAVSVCDELDGVKDGRIGNPEACKEIFKPNDYVGQTFMCAETGSEMNISAVAVSVASAVWEGPRFSDGRFMWYGFDIGTDLTKVAPTTCTKEGKCAVNDAGSVSISTAMRYFVDREYSSNTTKLTHKEFDHMFRTLKKLFASNFETNNPDLTEFREAGGKLLTYHGLTEPNIPSESTLHYYKDINETIGGVDDFYKYFLVPGLDHCWGGATSHPTSMFQQLVDWVEKGEAPTKSKVTFFQSDSSTSEGIVCPWPRVAQLSESWDFASAKEDCWTCVA